MAYENKTVAWNSISPAPGGAAPHAADVSSNVLPVGTRLGEFEILGVIGEGGFGIVYRAYDHSLERDVALKEYMPSGLASRTRTMVVTVKSEAHTETFDAGLRSFINEARLLAQFDSPSLVKVFRFWEANGTAYMVMPFYEGVTLKQAMRSVHGGPSEAWIKTFLANLFDAIEVIHRVNCFHRDIAPDNILLLPNGRPVLLDFGAARRVIGDRTQAPTAILKPGFAPIEQYADIPGLKQGPWTDVYALGAVVYYLISGKTPVPAVSRMVSDTLVPAKQLGKGRFSDSFLAVMDRAMAVRPENRFRNIAEMRSALAILDDMPRTLPPMQQGTAQQDETTSRTLPMSPGPAARAQGARSGTTPPRMVQRLGNNGKAFWAAAIALLVLFAAGAAYWGIERKETATSASIEQPADQQRSTPLPGPGTAEEPKVPPSAPPVAATEKPEESKAPKVTASPPVSPALPPVTEPSAPPAPPSPSAPQLSLEERQWIRATEADDISGYSDYLRLYPKGRFAANAKAALDRLKPKPAAPPAPVLAGPAGTGTEAGKRPDPNEEIAWSNARHMDRPTVYESFLNRYPGGMHAGEARARLEALRSAPTASPAPSEAQKDSNENPRPGQSASANADRKSEGSAPATTAGDNGAATRNKTPPAEPRSQDVAGNKAAESPPSTAAGTKAQTPSSAGNSPPAPSGSRKTIRVADQTMTGDFTMDPITGAVSGKGKIVWDNGDQFEGLLVHGIKQGKGEFIWANGQRYRGEWARGLPNGKGVIEFPNGNRYTGDMRDGAANGTGTIVFGNGDRYHGEVKDGLPNGHGTTQFSNGDVYTGAWRQGKSNGQGRYTWVDGTYWEGEFQNDRKTENGKLVRASGAAAQGKALDRPNGEIAGPASDGNAEK